MMQYQQQRPPRTVPVREPIIRGIKQMSFPLFIAFALLLAFPSFLVGFIVWWRSLVVWDRREFWRTAITIAIFGLVGYVAWIWVADPLPWLVSSLLADVGRQAWEAGAQVLTLLWAFNLWLAPAIVPVLAVLYPGRKGMRPFERVVAPKAPAVGQMEQEERDLETTAQATFERMMATLPSSALEQKSLARAAGLVSPTTIVIPGAGQASYEVLGRYEGGELEDLVQGGEVCLPPELLEVHGVLIGEPKFGKSTTLLRLAAIARAYGRKVIYLDLKGSKKTAALFLASMSLLNVQRIKLYPLDAYDGWRGDPQALYNRLMEQIDPASHPFYRSGVGSTVVGLAVKAPSGPPKNSYEFLERLDIDWLAAAYATDAQALREIKAVEPHIGGLALVMAGFFRGVAGGLDGSWAIDDVDACYIGMNGVDHKEEASTFGRYILEDAANYAMSRKDPQENVFLIIDEFGVLRSTNATALYESVREAGMSVYAAGQSYQSLGRERDSLLAASAIKILHRTGNPRPIVEYAGERERFAFSRMVGGAGDEEELLHPTANRPGDEGDQQTIMRPQKELAVPVEEVQRLEVGQIALISGGRGGYVQVHELALPPVVVQAASRYIASHPKFQSLPPPQLPPAVQQPGQQQPGKQRRRKAVPGTFQAGGPPAKSKLSAKPAQVQPAPVLPQGQTGQNTGRNQTNGKRPFSQQQRTAPPPVTSQQQRSTQDDDDLDFFS